MFRSFILPGLMLVIHALFITVGARTVTSIHPYQVMELHRPTGNWRLAGRDQPTGIRKFDPQHTATPCEGDGCVGAGTGTGLVSSNLPCHNVNGTTLIAGQENRTWVMLCDVDFFAQDIYPFLVAQTFEECLHLCESHNTNSDSQACAGFVFAPDRISFENDCYLKSSVKNAVSPSAIHLLGAILLPQHVGVESLPGHVAPTNADDTKSSDHQVQAPHIVEAKSLGTSVNDPTTQYVVHPPSFPKKLATSLVKPGINLDLVTKYPLAPDTGSWTTGAFTSSPEFGNMSVVPRLSRDGGRGGNINGTHIFVFCDTATFGDEDTTYMGYMNGFVSSSAAVADNKNALDLDHLVLRDTVGQWQDDVGRLRGWIEQTTGEQAFNIEISGDGYRYAIWPDSSFIPLNGTSALLYAPVVYVEVNMTTQKSVFYSLGNSLVVVSADTLGPHADRVVNLLFQEPEVDWGSIGGLRAWGASGNETLEGMLYLFGQVEGGILVAKVNPHSMQDRSSYEYWTGSEWSSTMPGRDSTAFLIEQPVMNFDIFYSPFHQYFFMVYMTPDADNTFWYRYLKVPASRMVIPPYMPEGDPDYCERILHDEWSEPLVLWKIDTPQSGYAYAGGAHMGFFGADDIIYGGNYLLITWTEHTEKDPNDPASGYAHKAARIRLA